LGILRGGEEGFAVVPPWGVTETRRLAWRRGKPTLLGAALLGGGDDVGKDENIVFAPEIAGGGGEDGFGTDVELAVAGEGHADVVFAEKFGDFDGRRERMGGQAGFRG